MLIPNSRCTPFLQNYCSWCCRDHAGVVCWAEVGKRRHKMIAHIEFHGLPGVWTLLKHASHLYMAALRASSFMPEAPVLPRIARGADRLAVLPLPTASGAVCSGKLAASFINP